MPDAARPVRVRFAPSPTGFLHIGNLRTLLYNWLFARHHHGTFVLRIEDTDQARYVEGAIESLYASMETTGLVPDEGIAVIAGRVVERGEYGPYLQSARRERHLAYARGLIDAGQAYYCFCSKERLTRLAEEQQALKQAPMYDRRCRSSAPDEAGRRVAAGEPWVIRLAMPAEGTCVFEDCIRGRIQIPWAQVDDQVIVKTDGYPTYHLANTCDDHDMRISHVFRGEEWISSTPKHVFIYQAFGWQIPAFAHLPLLLNADRSKLSKRQGDVAVEDYFNKGYVPEALINFIALMGWNPTSDREVFSKEELAELFDLAKVNKAGAVFNLEKLNWLNAQYLRQLPEEKYLAACLPWVRELSSDATFLRRACLIVRERLEVLNQLPELIGFLFIDDLTCDLSILPWKTQPPAEARERLQALRDFVSACPPETFVSSAELECAIRGLIAERGWGNGDTLWPLRVALSGSKHSPSPFELLFAYGKERAVQRIDQALERLARQE